MNDIFLSLYSRILTPEYFRLVLSTDIYDSLFSSRRNINPLFSLCEKSEEFALCHKNLISEEYIDVKKTLVEIICFFSSIGRTLQSMREKTVLVIGSSWGLEVALLQSLHISAIGIEKESNMVDLSMQFFKFVGLSEEYIIHEDVSTYMQHHNEVYAYIIGRNLNPLASVPIFIDGIGQLLQKDGLGIIQWDALYREDIAHSLYAPKKHIVYNEKLRELLDSFYYNTLRRSKPRASFLYLCSK